MQRYRSDSLLCRPQLSLFRAQSLSTHSDLLLPSIKLIPPRLRFFLGSFCKHRFSLTESSDHGAELVGDQSCYALPHRQPDRFAV
ncbi:MAG: hypothetical protein ACE5F5_11540, partial [Acidimicrobiia bacterium]